MSAIYDSCYKNRNEMDAYEQNIRHEMTAIIQDILTDIINIAVEKCEHVTIKHIFDMQQGMLDGIASSDICTLDTEQNCDSKKNYNSEMKTVLQNLECMTIKTAEDSVLCSLEQQIQNIIEEIKDLDKCVREESGNDATANTIQVDTRLDGYSSTIGIEARSALINLTLSTEQSNLLLESDVTDDISDEEIELQVIDLNSASNVFQESYNKTTSDVGQQVEEINCAKQNMEPVSLEQGDHCDQNPDNIAHSLGVENNDIDSSELEGNVCDKSEEQCVTSAETKKKMNLGSRLWIFFTRKQHSANASMKKQ